MSRTVRGSDVIISNDNIGSGVYYTVDDLIDFLILGGVNLPDVGDVPVTLPISGAVPRPLEEYLGDTVNVKDFGAKGDGVADDWPSVQLAWNYAAATGRKLWLPAGTYNLISVSASLVPSSGMAVFGDGMENTKIKWNPSDPSLALITKVSAAADITGFELRDLHIEGGHGDGGNYAQTDNYPVLLWKAHGSRISRVKISKSRVMGMVFRLCSGVDIRECVVQFCARDGINTGDCFSVSVVGNRVEYVDDDAIAHATQIFGVVDKGFECVGNIVRFAQGIRALSASTATITGNNLEFCMTQGISVATFGPADSSANGRSAACGVIISGNTIKNCFDRANVDNLNQAAPYIRISGNSAQASGLAAIPGENDTATGTVISPYPYFGNPNNGNVNLPVPASYHITITGNTFVRDVPTGGLLSSLGYGTFYTRNGPVDPTITNAAILEAGIFLAQGPVRNVLIANNMFAGIGSAVQLGPTSNFRGVMFSKNVVFDCDAALSAAGTENHNISFIDNVIDLDPFHASTNRGLNGTWLADGSPTAFLCQSANGFAIGGNVIRNVCRVADFNLNSSPSVTGTRLQLLPGNVVECDPSTTGFSTSNKGVGNVPRAGSVIHRIVDADPASATFRQVLNNCPVSFNAQPTTGKYVAGHVVWNNTQAVAGAASSQYIVAGWARMTTGSAHVLNTDWREMRTLTGT